MKTILSVLFLAAAAAETVNFDKADPGKPPAGWTCTQTGSGQAKWHPGDASRPDRW